ncbi:acylphosphatase [Sinisalibacter aestuarii]|uniref:Acylphosphatase n=1 Tax=Sinisalibacter aestuarii TaxID=2949426 RepID=A0ABQ5LVD5_9RHOB|nr:acylphosphatase [Sinisalibacter aestuarii]GKY88072.1 acylphosphatase [Sinisalibacter aestuarii]
MEGLADTALRAHVEGRVQGVAFRAWTKGRARALGLTGWVRNEADGSVSALIAGDTESVAQMVRALHDGPIHARVTRVTTERADPAEAPPDFRVIY